MEEYRARNPWVAYPVYRSYAAAAWATLPHLVRNPGCGMNAGAAPTWRELSEVKDFALEAATAPAE